MMATSALALAFLSRAESMIISLGLLALLGACLNPSQSLMLTLTTGVIREKNRTSAIGLMYTANEAASVASPFLGGLIAQAVGTPGIVSLLLPALPHRHEHRLAHSRGAEKARSGERRHLEFLKRGDLFRNMCFHHQRAGIIYIKALFLYTDSNIQSLHPGNLLPDKRNPSNRSSPT